MDKIVSVVIPFYNNKIWLKEALLSVKNQDYTNLDVVIVHDGSDENIDDLIEDFSSYRFFYIPNVGAGKARNYGIDKAIGDYICFLDSDDLWEPEKVREQLQYMLSENLFWSHTNYIKFWDDNYNRKVDVRTNFSGKIIPKMFISCPIATPCVMVKRSVFLENADLRFASYKVGEDSYLWLKIAQLHDLGHLNKFLTLVRIRGTNAAMDSLSQLESKAQSYHFLKSNESLFKSRSQYLIVIFGFYISYQLYHCAKYFQKLNFSKRITNILSTILYSIPYLYLKSVQKIISL